MEQPSQGDSRGHSATYSYFETLNEQSGRHGTTDVDIQSLQEAHPFLTDASFNSPPFWRIFPHLLAWISTWFFLLTYFDGELCFMFPILFIFPLFIAIAMKTIFKKYPSISDYTTVSSFVNIMSWGYWLGGIALYFFLAMIDSNIPPIVNASTCEGEYPPFLCLPFVRLLEWVLRVLVGAVIYEGVCNENGKRCLSMV